jgi:hypothetical protein
VVALAEGGDAGVILGFLATKLRSRYYLSNPAYCGKYTWLHGKPRITRPLSCRTNSVNSVHSEGTRCPTYLVLVVEGLETYLMTDVSVPLVPGAEESG